MKKETYVINYGVYLTDGFYESGKIKVKNCMSEIHAKIKIEGYLKKKHEDFSRLVIHKCVHDILGIFDFLK